MVFMWGKVGFTLMLLQDKAVGIGPKLISRFILFCQY